jgi:addiction module HigA family antidote
MDILPIHPGKILFEEFMQPYKLSQNALAKALKVPPRRINEIVHTKRGISVDTALRLSKFFGTTPEFWLNLQLKYDLETEKDKKIDIINGEVEKFVA